MPSIVLQYFGLAIAGGLFSLGFAPFGWWPLPLLTLAILFVCFNTANKKQSFIMGLCFGLGQFGVGVSWVYVSMVNFGNMSPVLAVVAVILMTVFLACYPALAALSFTLLKSGSKIFNLIFLAPACWVLWEALRSHLFTGFPWLLAGYSSIDSWLVGYAPIGGVVMLSLLTCLIAGLVGLAFSGFSRTDVVRSFGPLIVIAFLFGVGAILKSIQWTKPTGQELTVGMVQLDVPLGLKWQEGMQDQIMRSYIDASQSLEEGVDLLIWPEGALPQFYHQMSATVRESIERLKPALVFGSLERRELGNEVLVHNSMVLLDGEQLEGKREQIYRKYHLVPFGEFFPLEWLLTDLLAQLQVPMSNMTSWYGKQPYLSSKGFNWLPTICYEDAFPEDWRASIPNATAILNISEDAWFGDSFAPHQRLEMGRMRSIETGREMVRVSNSGLSTVVRVDGSYDQITPQFEAVILSDKVNGYQGETPYVKWGQLPVYMSLFIILLFRLFCFNSKYNRRNKH
ncbi:MAG: apolipoprotein N-acyltransferase [Saprospiraceae bacterium]|jgi:apolipoprotein N-acyltransferase